ncbi:hypothetical protein GWN26_05745 [Candidatus Saccharibacteria bacterium]|nr:hypothetical protein [Calditrichia bacterium]NIV98663.1 hypothetical protein [Candidatus Saccharibacteria bacterium]NIW78913.1 hypothetical protein [Calditrichia bacterium]
MGDFLNGLNEAVRMTIRDYFMGKEARAHNFQQLPNVQKELARWRDKWTYKETRHRFTEDVDVSEEEIKTYFAKFKDRYKARKDSQPELSEFYQQVKHDAYQQKVMAILNQKIASLKERYPVSIDEAVLDTISVTDFKKSRWAQMQIFKAGTNRRAFPTVDPAWGER